MQVFQIMRTFIFLPLKFLFNCYTWLLYLLLCCASIGLKAGLPWGLCLTLKQEWETHEGHVLSCHCVILVHAPELESRVRISNCQSVFLKYNCMRHLLFNVLFSDITLLKALFKTWPLVNSFLDNTS